jgi:spermidine synthase
MINFYVYLAVIVSGASVLAIELLGTRVIAPFYGASLYLWSALISVTLAALSLGYAIGGRLADRNAKMSHFCTIIGIAGVWVAVIPWLRVPVLATTEGLGLRAAVLITATVLFFPPLTLLGMVSPYAIRLKANSLSVVGRTAGNLYAVSTLASVAAAVATGFFLIPNIGVSRLFFLIGIALVGTALIGLIGKSKSTASLMASLVIVAGTLLFFVAPILAADPKIGLIAAEDSAYAEIRIVDLDDTRYMLIDGGMHTGVDPVTWESHFQYVYVLDIAKNFFRQAGQMLLVGLGGGSVVKNYARDGWRVDAVEIDPVVTRMARDYFGLSENEAQVYTMDGRQYLINHDKVYDIIVMDAFGSSSIPFHLVTEEAFGLIRSRLTPDGILAMNFEAVGWHDVIVKSLAATAGRQFKHVIVLPIAEPPDQLGNLILLASNRSLSLEKELPVPMDRFSPEYDRAHSWDNRFEVNVKGITVLTDDLNPVDIWSERVNLVSRRELHAFLNERGTAW